MPPFRHILPQPAVNTENIQTDNNDDNTEHQRSRRPRATNRPRKRRLYKIALNFQETALAVRHTLKPPRVCSYCGAKLFSGETEGIYCISGKIKTDEMGNHFRVNIRAYNSAFAFTSMGVKIDKALANGSLIPDDDTPRFLQLYIYDTEHETDNRLTIMPKLRRDILEILGSILDQFNLFVINFRSISSHNFINNLQLHIKADHGLDQRIYNTSAASKLQLYGWKSERLNYLRFNQDKLRKELYQGLYDSYYSGITNASNIGTQTVLTSSFMGSSRDLYQRYQDSMALVQTFGKPDLFITITCNSKWTEVSSELLQVQNSQDRPDITESCWRIFSFDMSQINPSVVRLQIYLPHQQTVIFSQNTELNNIINDDQYKKTILTKYFKINKNDPNAKNYFYHEFPRYYVWNKMNKK
ncbi:23639_t:CDS:2 [Dentiscutata erythropus]|uniref:23639_t:CDS:1 n=1 Tax=Dentiscutata erythropus TaxID=1348616 RepID=A0A9N9IKZ8_9GLOM|nr:23639_t:CDS:2 [Dentiscutata erythropus]